MKNVFLLKTFLLFNFLTASIAWQANSVSYAENAEVNKRQDIRLYRINKDGIATRFWFTRGKANKAGCHNIRKRSRLHRAVQFGFSECKIFTQKDCADDSVLSFSRKDAPQPETKLEQGYSWFVISDNERGELVKSWHCVD